jgi:large subunit ribosomal protein L21
VFAVIQAQGHRYASRRVSRIELDGTEKARRSLFDQVLLIGTDNGDSRPVLPPGRRQGARRVVALHIGPKLRIFKKKRRKQYRRTAGHRSALTRVRITDIVA